MLGLADDGIGDREPVVVVPPLGAGDDDVPGAAGVDDVASGGCDGAALVGVARGVAGGVVAGGDVGGGDVGTTLVRSCRCWTVAAGTGRTRK